MEGEGLESPPPVVDLLAVGLAGDGVLDCLMATKNIAASISADGLRAGSATMAWKVAMGESCAGESALW